MTFYIGDKVHLWKDFWVTELSHDKMRIVLDYERDINPSIELPRCIPMIDLFPHYMDFVVPSRSKVKILDSYYIVSVPPDFHISGGRYYLRGIRETLEDFAPFRGEFERDVDAGEWLNFRLSGKAITGEINRIYLDDKYFEFATMDDRLFVVVVEPTTQTEYHILSCFLTLV